MKEKSSNVVWHNGNVLRSHRESMNRHKSVVLWFTGLSGAGKSTLAHAVELRLYGMGVHTYVLDGDNVRHGLCGDLGFSDVARRENIRRVGEVSRLFVDAGVVVLTAFISPFLADRSVARSLVDGDFIEIFCDCSLEICELRDAKGLYKRARTGEIKDFTGISSPYETPLNPELTINTGNDSIQKCVDTVIYFLIERGIIKKAED